MDQCYYVNSNSDVENIDLLTASELGQYWIIINWYK